MPFHGLNMVVARKPPVAVHHEGHMLRNRSLLKGADQDLSQLSYCPCDWRRGCEPFVYAGVVEGTHCWELLGLAVQAQNVCSMVAIAEL